MGWHLQSYRYGFASAHSSRKIRDLDPGRSDACNTNVRGMKVGIARLLDERQRRSDIVVRVARLLRLPVIVAALAVGVILARRGHFGLHL